jgi:hypothetical protein
VDKRKKERAKKDVKLAKRFSIAESIYKCIDPM